MAKSKKKANKSRKLSKATTKNSALRKTQSKKSVVKKPSSKSSAPVKQKFTVSIQGDEVRYFACVPSKSDLTKLKGKGITTEAGVMTLSDTLSGDEETTWVSPSSVSAFVNGKPIPIKFLKNEKLRWNKDHRRKNVIFVEQTIDKSEWTAEVEAFSIDNIQVEMHLSEHWILPDDREIEIYTLEIVNPVGADLEFQGGGGGYISGELITADGESVGLDEEENEDTGEYRVKVSND